MITLYHSPRSRSSRMIWLLEELGAPYRIEQVSIFRPMTGDGSPDPRNPHPAKQVPAIEHDGAVVSESVAITLYLTDLFPEARLGAAIGDPQRGAYLSWLAWYAAELEPMVFAKFSNELDAAPMKQRRYDGAMARIEGALSAAPYLLGDRFTAADLLLASALSWARQAFPESAVLDAYAARCNERPAAIRAQAKDEANGPQG